MNQSYLFWSGLAFIDAKSNTLESIVCNHISTTAFVAEFRFALYFNPVHPNHYQQLTGILDNSEFQPSIMLRNTVRSLAAAASRVRCTIPRPVQSGVRRWHGVANSKLERSLSLITIPILDDNYSFVLVDYANLAAAVVDPAEPSKILPVLRDLLQNEGVETTHILTSERKNLVSGSKE